MSDPFVAGLVLAAGGSRTVGRPTPLLPYAGRTLLDHTLATARACEFDELLVAVDHADKVRARVDLSGTRVVRTLAQAVEALDPATTVLVVLRGDQPGATPAAVRVLLAARSDAPIAVCRYEDERGHPYAFSRYVFDDLRAGRPIRRLLERHDVAEVPVAGHRPPDVDTWADYEAVVAAASFTTGRGLRS